MHKNATKCNETLCKWCKNKHGASKIIDTFETYHLLVTFHVYDMKKILVDALGTLRTTGTLSLLVLNAAKEWVRPGPRLKSKGIEFEVGDKYLL
jgi:hypothetical protein